jgi:hypothetical protein
MATAVISWGDGTGDRLTATFNGGVGVEKVTISSNPNRTANERTKTLTLKSQGGALLASLTVTQGVSSLLTLSGVQALTCGGSKIIVNA